MKNIRTVLVDDVEVMRITLKKVLAQFPHIEIVGEASTFDEARDVINNLQPDLVLLDIDLNGLTSIDIIGELNCTPKIIFITSHENFAVKAFELNAVDYIIKPISAKRISAAIEKIAKPPEAIQEGSIDNDETFQSDQIILLNFDNKMNFIKIKDINFIEAYGNYTKVNMDDGKLSITYNSIKNWDSKLPEDIFIQIHRSTIVNLLNVQKIEKWTNDTGRLYLKDIEKPFEISRSYFFQIKKKYKM
ncbi:MAG: LytTR family DNA-binding domain-containing protein [Bacteroidia bacterium]|nr:LytTR family DNA-binding domain-containing protein [Bacteroidia bacterium]